MSPCGLKVLSAFEACRIKRRGILHGKTASKPPLPFPPKRRERALIPIGINVSAPRS